MRGIRPTDRYLYTPLPVRKRLRISSHPPNTPFLGRYVQRAQMSRDDLEVASGETVSLRSDAARRDSRLIRSVPGPNTAWALGALPMRQPESVGTRSEEHTSELQSHS